MTTRIVLADDHGIFRDGLATLLEAEPDFQVVGRARDGQEVLDIVAERPVDVVVMDISMPGMNGIDATRRLAAGERPPRVVILSMHSDRRFVLGALRAGASAYLLKDGGFTELAAVIREVRDGGVRLSPEITDVVVADYVRLSDQVDDDAGDPLTPRERDVVSLLVAGSSTRDIASRTGLTVSTVNTYLKRIFSKLGVHSRVELVARMAGTEGLGSTMSTAYSATDGDFAQA